MDGESVLRAGYRLDRYELLCPVASGGMAAVWLARLRGKRGFEKLVAIKTILTELGEDPRFQEMFLDEARIASGIEHPNVAQILDLGEQDDILYIVMEWVDGESLAKVARQARKARDAAADRAVAAHPRRRVRGSARRARAQGRERRACSASSTATCRRRTSSSASTAR